LLRTLENVTAVRPTAILVGSAVRLDPLSADDMPALYAAIGHPQVFAGGFGGGPTGYTTSVEDFARWAEGYFSWGASNVHAVRLVGGEHDGLLVGTTTLGDFDLANEHAHIGWTAYDPRVWGTAVNVEAKLLMLQAAFDHGFGRVKLQADVLNDRSRGAIAKLGATFEGIVRRDKQRADGSWRDAAVFSVIVDEWPLVKAGLEARLAAYGAQPVALRATDDGGAR
jgi:RimJ/RimL family protein N-acetyltransferase